MKKSIAVLLLLIATFFWGLTFTVVKGAVAKIDVFVFLSQRFCLAFAVLLCLCLIKKRPLSRDTLRHGAVLGTFLFSAFAFQTVALQYTSATNTAFLTGLNVVLVPIIGTLWLRQPLSLPVGVGVVLATVGLFLLCTDGGAVQFNAGDVLAAVSAVCVALHLLFTSRFARKGESDIFWLTTVQIGSVFLLSLITALLRGEQVLAHHAGTGWPVVLCALFATVFAFLIQTTTQRVLSPAHTAFILCCEPVFGAIYAFRFGNESLGSFGILGAALIVGSTLVSEFLPRWSLPPLPFGAKEAHH